MPFRATLPTFLIVSKNPRNNSAIKPDSGARSGLAICRHCTTTMGRILAIARTDALSAVCSRVEDRKGGVHQRYGECEPEIFGQNVPSASVLA